MDRFGTPGIMSFWGGSSWASGQQGDNKSGAV